MTERLNPGASTKQIDDLERTIQHRLPEDVRQSLAIHNGDTVGFLFTMELLDIDSIAGYWQLWSGLTEYNDEFRDNMSSFPKGMIKTDYANPGWIPLIKAASADHVGVDLDPSTKGSSGQVINFGREEREKCVLAKSWGEFLWSYASFLESGPFESLHRDVDAWDENFESVFATVTDQGQYLIAHPLDVLVRLRKQNRWPVT